MRRLLGLVLAVMLLIGVPNVSASSIEDLNALATYYSADTLVFGAIRTDADFVTTVDGLLAQVLPFLPPDQVPPVTVPTLLDRAASEMGVSSFEEGIRPWLGDTATIGVKMNPDDIDADPFVTIVIAVEGEGARDFLDAALAAEGNSTMYAVNKVGGFFLYVPTSEFDDTFIAVGNDVLVIANTKQGLSVENMENPLSENADFNATMALLPQTDYSALAYVNNARVQQLFAEGFNASGQILPEFYTNFTSAVSGQAMGFTITDDRALVIDVAQAVDYAALGLPLEPYAGAGIDFAFANHIPADAALVIQSAEFGTVMQASYNQIRVLGDWLKENGGLANLIDPDGREFDPEETAIINQFDPAMLLGIVNLTFAGGTGLSMERDVFQTLDGDMALYLRARQVEDFPMSPILPDIGMIFGTSNPDAALHIVDRLAEATTAYEAPFTTEDYGSGRALVVPSLQLALGSPYAGLDFLVGASDDVFALGTRPAVMAALESTGGLADDATYQSASAYFLPGSQQVWYFNAAPLLEIAPAALVFTNGQVTRDMQDAYRLASVLNSASISAVTTGDGVTMVRMVLSLADSPREFPANGL